MPKFLQISDFAKAGLNTDLMPWDLPGSFLTEMRNVRVVNKKLVPFGGSTKFADLPVDFYPGHLFHVGSTSGLYWMLLGKDKVYVFNGSTFTDVSSTAGYAGVNDELRWTACHLTNIPVINHPGHVPEYWPQQSAGIQLEPLPWDATNTWSDVGESCRIMRSHKQFLFAMDLQSGLQEIRDGVRWSSPADIGGVPDSWDHLDTTNVAGLVNLGGNAGNIIDGLSLRDAFCVYRESGVSVFDFIGGNFVWRIRHLSDTIGLIAPNCITEVKGSHYFIGDGDLLVNDGNTIASIAHNRIRRRFSSQYDADNYLNSYCVKNNIANEVWFCVPEQGQTYPNVAYVYNWRDDTWSVKDIPEGVVFSNYGPQNSPPVIWDDMNNQWDQFADFIWNQRQLSPFDDTVIGVTQPAGAGQSGKLLLLGNGRQQDASPFDIIIERVGFALEGLNNVTTITRVYPHMSGPGDVLIEIGSQDHPGSPVRWKPGVVFDPDTDRKVDIRTTGELHSFRISKLGNQKYFEISGIDIDYVLGGLR